MTSRSIPVVHVIEFPPFKAAVTFSRHFSILLSLLLDTDNMSAGSRYYPRFPEALFISSPVHFLSVIQTWLNSNALTSSYLIPSSVISTSLLGPPTEFISVIVFFSSTIFICFFFNNLFLCWDFCMSLFVLRESVITCWIFSIMDALYSVSDKIGFVSVLVSVLILEWFLIAGCWVLCHETLDPVPSSF